MTPKYISEGNVVSLETGTKILMKSFGASSLYNYVKYTENVFLEFGTKVPALSTGIKRHIEHHNYGTRKKE